MRQESLDGWEHFEERLREIKRDREQRLLEQPYGSSKLLFRGQPNSCWSLSTTLERYVRSDASLEGYYRLIAVIQPQVETFTERRWDATEVPKYPDGYSEWVKEKSRASFDFPFHQLPGFGYMAYLRHHGFPSPLLDWTRSPYVAAFFAFNGAVTVKKVSIYVYWEAPDGLRSDHSGPCVHRMGPYVRSHRRHFLQQSEYTISAQLDNSEWKYVAHEESLSSPQLHPDVLWKFDLPATERVRVLQLLHNYNLNEFSLFDSLESMLGTLALKELKFEERKI